MSFEIMPQRRKAKTKREEEGEKASPKMHGRSALLSITKMGGKKKEGRKAWGSCFIVGGDKSGRRFQ